MACAGELEPPWSRYPWIQNGSIGWRMGTGEGYQMEWGEFVDREVTDLAAAFAYLERHPPAPRTWTNWIASWLERLDGGTDAVEDDDVAPSPRRVEMRAELDERGIVGDDVAYPVFVRNAEREGGMTAPWTWRGTSTPHVVMRYSARELGWWARWVAAEAEDRAAWFARQPEPPEAWTSVAAAVRAGTAPEPWIGVNAGPDALIPILARLGTLPPPWNHPPIVEISWEDGADDRHRWAWWVFGTFEDAATWRAYLERFPPPESWREALAELTSQFE